ncbi:MAG: tRNA lysidine(34) synthetase TilS [Oscillospiraceae bacterium]|jgi:tRNA(Ile)-lysidine synthase|nr:tRNA lysidine(34) synthetase TilS [Oscillospiraceae bacterium]
MTTPETTLDEETPIQPTDDVPVVIAALSGGADSICMLHMLHRLQQNPSEEDNLPLRLKKFLPKGKPRFLLRAAHINHKLRGADSEADEAFCRSFCAQLGIPLDVKRSNCALIAKNRNLGLEEAGRQIRYTYFEKLALQCRKDNENRYVYIATAHNQNDLAETFLLNLGRGSALRGLCSIPEKRLMTCMTWIIRPILHMSRAQIEEYCRTNRLEYRTDASNFDCTYTRNRIRHEVLPALQAVFPDILKKIDRSVQLLAKDEDCLTHLAQGYIYYAKESESVLYRRHRAKMEKFGVEPTQARLKEAAKQGAVWYEQFKTALKKENPPLPTMAVPAPPAEIQLPNGRKIRFVMEDLQLNSIEHLQNSLDYGTINGNLTVGGRLPGDTMRLVNGTGTKPLKKLFAEHGIAPEYRAQKLILRDEAGIIWMEGFGCAHRCRLTGATNQVLRIIITAA